jgi:hypothetical protein
LLPDTQVQSTPASKIAIVALADFEVSAAETALIITMLGLGTLAGAV